MQEEPLDDETGTPTVKNLAPAATPPASATGISSPAGAASGTGRSTRATLQTKACLLLESAEDAGTGR